MARSSWCRRVAALLIAGALAGSGAVEAKPAGSVLASPVGARRWETLPLPGPLPKARQEGTFAADDVKLWFATFGEGPPVVLLHGGLGSSRHFSSLITALVAKKRRVIAMDSRGHGRSTRSARGISYRQMADDVVALLDHLAIERAAIVGWSDGGATGLDVAIRYPERLGKLFVIGTNYAVAGTKKGGSKSKTFPEYFALCRRQYAELSPDPGQLNGFLGELRAMWGSQPNYTAEQLASIAAPVVVALGEHDEVVRLDHVQQMVKHLGRGRLVVLPGVSHFAMWQDPAAFNAKVIEFLEEKPATTGERGTPGKVTPPPPSRLVKPLKPSPPSRSAKATPTAAPAAAKPKQAPPSSAQPLRPKI